MDHSPEYPPKGRAHKEYEDPHYHDEDEMGGLPSDESYPQDRRPHRGKSIRKLSQRRWQED